MLRTRTLHTFAYGYLSVVLRTFTVHTCAYGYLTGVIFPVGLTFKKNVNFMQGSGSTVLRNEIDAIMKKATVEGLE